MAPSKSVFADFDTLICRSRATPASVHSDMTDLL
jgi:hypothetical protein